MKHVDFALAWYHLVLNARGTWLTGDDRGFRSRHHRIHSSGDYKSPPPSGEHAGLHRHVKAGARQPTGFPPDLFETLGRAVIEKIEEQGWEVLAVSVDAHHVHLLVRVPDDRREIKQLMKQWKQLASHRVRHRLPGRIWASSGDPVRIRDRPHQLNVFRYILDHVKEGAWVWRFDRR